MNQFLFDINGIAFLFLPFVLFFIFCGLAGGLVLYAFRINRFWTGVKQMLLTCFLNFILIFLIWQLVSRLGYNLGLPRHRTPLLILFWLISVITEAILLKAMNRKSAWERIFIASITMNLAAYIVIYSIMIFES